MLELKQANLYQRLQEYQLDDPAHEFGFTRHLRKNHGWSKQYAARAIAEYKKFLYLTIVAEHQIVPSDPVDQVWHAHLLVTQSYWEDFCPNVLGQTLHHHPARGGHKERAEFHKLYLQTIESYRKYFGSPPVDLWAPPFRRFGTDLRGQRVNRLENWIIPKKWPLGKLPFTLSLVAIAVFLSIIAISQPSLAIISEEKNSIFFSPEILIVVSLTIGVILRFLICWPREQTQQQALTPYQVAYLSGRKERTIELALARLVDQGYLQPHLGNRTFSVKKTLPNDVHPIEREVVAQVEINPELKGFKKFNPPSNSSTRQQLTHQKLIISGWAKGIQTILKFICGLIVASIFFSGCLQGDNYNNVDSLYLSYLIGLLITFPTAFTSYRTYWGNTKLTHFEKTHDSYDLSDSVALYGQQAMSGGSLDTLRNMYLEEAREESANSCGCGC